jgi:hypothetical protein
MIEHEAVQSKYGTVGGAVSVNVGVTVGTRLGLTLGAAVGMMLGLDVGFAVGTKDGAAVGAADIVNWQLQKKVVASLSSQLPRAPDAA